MPSKPIRNPKFDDAFLVRLRIVAAAEEWSERTGSSLREAWRRIAFWTRKQLIKPFPTVTSFEDFRGRHRTEIEQYRRKPEKALPEWMFHEVRQEGVSRQMIRDAGYRIAECDAPTFSPHLKEDRDFARRTVRALSQRIKDDPTQLTEFLWDYVRLLGDMQPDRRNRTFRWAVYKDLVRKYDEERGRADTGSY